MNSESSILSDPLALAAQIEMARQELTPLRSHPRQDLLSPVCALLFCHGFVPGKDEQLNLYERMTLLCKRHEEVLAHYLALRWFIHLNMDYTSPFESWISGNPDPKRDGDAEIMDEAWQPFTYEETVDVWRQTLQTFTEPRLDVCASSLALEFFLPTCHDSSVQFEDAYRRVFFMARSTYGIRMEPLVF